MTEIVFGKIYEDRRTHRSGKLLEYNEKYKTYLLESSDGKTFNVTSSQLKNNWRVVEQTEVQEPVKPKVEKTKAKPVEPKKEEKSDEGSKELNDLFTSSTIYINDYVQSFKNDNVSMYICKPITKNTIRVRIDYWVVFDVTILIKRKRCRVWLSEYDFNKTKWSNKPLCMKQYPGTNKNFVVEFDLENLPKVLEDLRPVVLDKLAEIVGGIKDEIQL